MRAWEPYDLTLPAGAVINGRFAFEDRLAGARGFLAERGIHEVRPVYRTAARRTTRTAPILVSRLDVRPAANDAATRVAIEETAA